MLQLSCSVGTSIKLSLPVCTVLMFPGYDGSLTLVFESITAMKGNTRLHYSVSYQYIQIAIIEFCCHTFLVNLLSHKCMSLTCSTVFYILVV